MLYKGQEISITPAACVDARQQILSTSEELTKISQALKANSTRVDAGESVDLAATIWMFHVGLDSSDWEVRDIGDAIDFRDFLVLASREVSVDISVETKDETSNGTVTNESEPCKVDDVIPTPSE